ncbi:deaminase [Yinghuangia sp. ASG 101]|uniref:deaminase n=1 Tax=Yinghuangia sp. ASG 101 TaxID=2896848 RepID=UPI001E354E30|nr:deaminase [Yinghuangia sp. ASG 101]UGQ12524.1 deaminase [Yinghuangia sp. ASG 101]
MDEAVWRGRALLDDLEPTDDRIAALADRLAGGGHPAGAEDAYGWLACVLALVSANEGNYGVGAVVVRGGTVVAEGRNRLLWPRRNTSAHAEAEALDRFEARFPEPDAGRGAVLHTSLECCPMCTVRLLNSGIRDVRYLAPDPDGGMLTRMDGLPPYWRRLASGRVPAQVFGPATCAVGLRRIAAEIFAATETRLNDRVMRH